MPNVVVPLLANANTVFGGPYMDNHAPAPFIRNSTPSAFKPAAGSHVPSANDISGGAHSFYGLSAQWAKNNNAAHVNQGTQV